MLLRIALSFALIVGVFRPAMSADQLVMFEQVGCPFCAAWNRDVGGVYPKTDEARVLPLRRVDIHADRPADLRAVGDIHFTPTFVVMHCGHEAMRMVGYTGDANFWGLLDHEVDDLKGAAPCAS